MNRLVLWGAGGHGRVVLDIARALNCFCGIEFIDERSSDLREECCGCRVHHSLDETARSTVQAGALMVISIGSNRARARCAAAARRRGWKLATLIHPSAIVSPSAQLGEGTVVMPRAVVNAGAVVGENCIINTGALVEHDCRIGDHVHLSPGTVLGGAVTIEDFAHMGLGSIALPGSIIGRESIVGAGAVVLHSAGRAETVVGVPARKIDTRDRHERPCTAGASC